MIASVRGTLLEKQPTRLVVEVGGVGMEVLVPLHVSAGVGEPGATVFLHTALIVREESLTLFGFGEPGTRELFQKLLSVSGVGPKTALGALSIAPEALVAAIREEDLDALVRLPGIGRKTAQRMVVDLRDSLPAGAPGAAGEDRTVADAVAALVSLGYASAAARKAVETARREADGEAGVEELLRAALTRLAKH